MDRVEAVKELKQYKQEKERLKYLEQKLMELREQMVYPSHNDIYVDGGRRDNNLELIMDKLIEIEQTYLSQLTYCYGILNDIQSKINMLKYPFDYILKQYYLEGSSIDDIAFSIKYSYDSVKRLKREAIDQYCALPSLFSKEYWAKRIS